MHPPGTAFVVTTAPTDKQRKATVWREISRAHKRGSLPGEVLQNAEWKIDGELVAYGRTPADHDEHAFQGIHARYVLVILDEACGVTGQLWTAAATLLTNEDDRILAIGNPDDPMSEFAAVCDGADPATGGMSQRGWNVLEAIDAAEPASVKIDSIGTGWGIIGSLRRERPNLQVAGVNVARAASQPKRFLNLRSEIWWDVARGLSKDQGWDLSGIQEESTLAELAAPQWRDDKSGRIVVESKDEIRKRLGRSTDNADALLLAFYSADVAVNSRVGRGR